VSQCIIYQHPNFEGDSYQVVDNIEDLTKAHRGLGGRGNWNDETSSIKVLSGKFRFFEDIRFAGHYVDLTVGEYSSVVDVATCSHFQRE
jgi:hypothetical protein